MERKKEPVSSFMKWLLALGGISLAATVFFISQEGMSQLDFGGAQMVVKKKVTPTPTPTPTPTTSLAPTSTITPTPVASWIYENSKYGFTLTFGENWKGYKVKQVAIQGALDTYYINIPTTDPLYQTESQNNYAGYAAPFAISAHNKSDWTGSEDQRRDFGSKIGENAQYVFTSSSWQAAPTDLVNKGIGTEIKTIVATFKLK